VAYDKVVGEQLERLCNLLKNPGVNWSNVEMRTNAIHFLRSFSQFATPAQRDDLSEAMRARFGLSPASLAFVIGCEDPAKLEDALTPPELRPALDEMFPKDGWLGRYVEFTRGHEAPILFHFWNGVSVLGATLSRRVFFEKHYYRVYPNHYVVLVAPTGKCKKSTALNIAVGVLRDSNVIEILSEKGTPEGILDVMARQVTAKPSAGGGATITSANPSLFIHAPELGVFMGKQEFNEGLVLMLTSIADCREGPFDYVTRTKGRLTLQSPSVHLLGGITPDGLAHSIPQSAFLGGTISRFMFVVQTDTPRIFALPKPANATLRAWLQAKLVSFSNLTGPVSMTTRAEEWYEAWYTTARQEQHDSLQLSGYFERKPDHLIRLALILTISEELPLELSESTLQRALALLELTQKFMPEAFSIVDATEQGRHYEVVVEAITKAGGKIDHSALLKRVYRYGVNADLLSNRIIPTLEQAGVVKEVRDTTKRVHFYMLTKR